MTAQPASSVELTKTDVIGAVSTAIVDMVVHAGITPQKEVIGAVWADGSIRRLYNEAKDQHNTFIVSPAQLKGLDNLVAVYHSHPNDVEYPSVHDEKGLAPIPIAIVTSLSVTLWWYADHIGYYRIWDRNYGAE